MKHTNFFLLTLLLGLFTLGSTSAWAGWRFQGQTGSDENWGNSDNMTQVGSSDVWYYKISNLSSTIEFKINNGGWEYEQQKYYEANTDDQNRGNVPLVCGQDNDSKHRFRYEPSTIFGSNVARDLYIFVKGDANNPQASDKVWAIAVTPGSGSISKAYSLRGDLWLDGSGWAGKNDQRTPVFVNMTNDVAAQLSYLIPIPSGSNAMKSRFTLISGTSLTNENKLETSTSTSSLGDGNYSPDATNGGKYKLTIPANGGSYPTVKRIVLDYYASGKLRARLEDYIVKRDGWHLYVDDKYMGAMSNSGSFTVEGLESGTHTIYIANYSHNSINSTIYNPYSDGGGKIHAQQWFGGLFIDMDPSHSNVSFSSKSVYYNSGDSYFGPQQYPINGQFDARGKFSISETQDVKFTFDGGVITIKALDGTEPAEVTYTGKEYVFFSKYQNHTDNNFFNFKADGAHLFVYFWNSETSANGWSDEAFFWDNGDNVLAAKVPAGTWTNCKIVRKNSNDSGKNWENVWNETVDLTIEEGKNYFLRTSNNSASWEIYTPPFYLTGTASLCGGSWDGWPYSGNGTTYNGTVTRENISAGTYEFKLNPTKEYGGWEHSVTNAFVPANSAGSNVTLSAGGGGNIQFTLSEASDVTIAYDGNGVTVNTVEHEAFTDEVYVYGAGGTNWVTGWSKPVEDYKMTISAGVASKTFYNVKGSGLNFKVWNKTTGSDIDWSKYDSSKSENVTCTNCSANNICFDLAQNSDVTVYTDGKKVWVKVQARQTIASDYVLVGEYQGWNNNDDSHKLTKTDSYTQTITLRIDPTANYCNNRIARFKIVPKGSWENQVHLSNVDDASSSYTKAPQSADWGDNAGNDNRILVQFGGADAYDATFVLWKNSAGNKRISIYVKEVVVRTVTFNTDGGSIVANANVEDGQTVTRPSDPSKGGYAFVNWYSDSEKTVLYDFSTPVTADITLYAKWEAAETRRITFVTNGGTAVDPVDVTKGTKLSSYPSTSYGNGTVTWCSDEGLTTAFDKDNTNINDNITLYAKWGVSGNYYIVGCLQTASDAGESGDWSNTLSRQMTYSGSQPGVCSFTFVAPAGKYPFEIIKNQSWSEKINGGSYGSMFDNSKSNVTLSESNGHLLFELSEPKQVTVSYDGKVWVNVTDYSFDNSKTWRIKTSWGNGGDAWNWNTLMTNNGTTNATAILRNVSGTNSFIISTKTTDGPAQEVIGNETFNALYVDMSSPSSGLTWNTSSVRRDGSNNFNSTTPQADGNYWRNCKFTLAEQSDIRITFDGGKIRCDILPKYTVTFDSNGGSAVASQTLFEGLTASEPADPTKEGYLFNGWKLNSENYNFNTPVTSNITLVADWIPVWTVTFNTNGGSAIDPQYVENGHTANQPAEPTKDNYTFNHWELNSAIFSFSTAITANTELVAVWDYTPAHVSSVGVSQASIYTWENDVTYTLVGSVDPADIDGATLTWSSDDHDVVTVDGGVITVVGPGTTNVTFKARDYYNTEKTATCVVTVAPCEKTVADAPKYSATITGYNTVEGTATLSGLWNQDADNNGMPQNARLVRIAFRDLATEYMTEDADGKVAGRSSITDNSDKWMYYSTGANSTFYLQNYKTGHYLYKDKSTGLMGQNGDWKFYGTKAAANAGTDVFKWLENGSGDNLRIVNYEDYNGGLNGSHTLMRYYVDAVDNWNTPYIRCGLGGHQGNNPIKAIITQVEASVANPFFVASQMNTSYYRMNTGATVTANCGALAELDVIRVALYADAATTVTLEKTDGTVVRTINLAAEAEKDFTYTLTDGSPLVGETAFVIKAVDNHAAIRSVAVTSLVAANPATPELHWSADLSEGVARLLLDGNFTYTASSNDSQGTISYSAEGATVNATTGEVTPPVAAGSATISATITADECHAARTISYNVSFLGLQDYINEESVSSVTLPGDFTGEDLVVNKALTIDGNGHSIGNLTVENSGDLTLSGNLTVNDFTICAKAGNSEHQAESGQVRNANYLTANGNAYFLYTVDPSGQVQYGWYDFTVPFPVNVMTGIKGIQNEVLKENFQNEVDYAVMEFLGDKLAEGQYSYKKFRGVMQPNKLYSITLDASANYNTVRFQKTADGALVASQSVTLEEHTAASDTRANWNGVGNGTLHHADAGVSAEHIQVYRDMTYVAFDKNECSLAVGTAIMVQATGTMTLNSASHGLFAPKRAASIPATTIQIAPEGKPFSDQLFISADETSGQSYTQGVDVAKAGSFGKARVPQIGTNAYNTLLCAHEAQLIDGQAQYALSLYAPANGTYTLTSNVSEDQYLFLTQNGRIIWNLMAPYTLDLTKGITTEYGLLLVENYKVPTGVENIQGDNVQCTKVLRNGVLYIINNGKVFNAQGANVK